MSRRRLIFAAAQVAASAFTSVAWPGLALAVSLVRVTLRIDLREAIATGRFDPVQQRVGVRGSVAPLDWGRTLRAEPTGEPGQYLLRFGMARAATGGQPVAYKFKMEPADAADVQDTGWEEGRNRTFTLPEPGLNVGQNGDELRLQRAWGENTEVLTTVRTGQIDVHNLPGPSGSAARKVQVWLPPGWTPGPSAPALPVLLLLDGDNQFDAMSAGAEWQMDEHAQAGVLAGHLRPFIAVAVSQGNTRVHDFTPWRNTGMGPSGGGGLSAYADWLTGTVLPFVRQRYGASNSVADTAIGGSSLGGLAAMWLQAERAQHFGAGLVVSPSVWWANGRILDTVANTTWATPPRVWLYAGGGEGRSVVNNARRLHEILGSRSVQATYVEDPEAGHTEVAWAARVPQMLRFLYGR